MIGQSENNDVGYIESFKLKAKAWAQDVVDVINTPVTGELAQDKAKLLRWAGYIKKGIEGVFGTIDELENVGLGILPLIPIAVVGASLAGMYKWTLDYQTFKRQVEEQKRLEARGVDPASAARMVAQKGAPSLISFGTLSPLLLIGLAGGAWYFFGRKR